MSIILGISGGLSHTGQDAAATIIQNGKCVFAMEEERFLRTKHARSVMPTNSIREGLKYINKTMKDVEFVSYYANYRNIKKDLEAYLKYHFDHSPEILFFDHHLCHAASTFYPSNFNKSIIFTADYSGDGISTTLSIGDGENIKVVKKFSKPNSLGIFYSMFTQVLGFNYDDDEYKVMGLAPYGDPIYDLNEIIQSDNLGNYNLKKKFINLKSRSRQSPLFNENLLKQLNLKKIFNSKTITKNQKDLAASVQFKLEEIVTNLLKDIFNKTQISNLCLAGGVSLNCAMIKKISDLKIFKNIFVQPASSDAGTSLGSAILASKKKNYKIKKFSSQAYLGNSFKNAEIRKILDVCNLKYEHIDKNHNREFLIEKLKNNSIFAIFRGRHEFGPRALGNRSIFANPKSKNMKSILNNKIKFREGFRPFAPIILDKIADKYFNLTSNIKDYKHMTINAKAKDITKEKFPSCVHVDSTSRVQILNKQDNYFIYDLLNSLKKGYDIDCLINTSFNVNKMPIVNTPQDALSCFYSSGIDLMLLGDYILKK